MSADFWFGMAAGTFLMWVMGIWNFRDRKPPSES